VSLIGICSGGNACWEMAIRYPEVFSAVVPATPGSGNISKAGRLAGIPIWAFHAKHEHPEGTEAMAAAVEQAGGNIYLTLEQSGAHYSWKHGDSIL